MVIIILYVISGCSSHETSGRRTLNGAGATFPYPVYSNWAYRYNQVTGIALNYQSIGSGAGIAQITAGTVDFGASDAPLTLEELDAAGLVQFPMIMGGVVPVINVRGVSGGQIKLTSRLLADIFLGKIETWNDPAIQQVNPGLNLPDRTITVVHRSDGSGTTWIFTNYLDAISPEWHSTVGTGKAVNWPAGVGGKGNEGVAAFVQRLDGAIGYVEYAYVLHAKMPYVLLQDSTGEYVAPSIESFQTAAINADWQNAPGFYMVLTNQPGKGSWPITGASFILIHKSQEDAGLAGDMLTFFDWCYRHGGEAAREIGYVPVPETVITLVEEMWAKEITAGGRAVWPIAE
ncbi:MAG: phosphate ABC transporter substrate-binding protein PstS [Candidatus Latescibacterota bacterium]